MNKFVIAASMAILANQVPLQFEVSTECERTYLSQTFSSQEEKVRKASHAGDWYTDDAKELTASLNEYLDVATKQVDKGLKAIIAPHASYRYSGATAGWAYVNIDPS